MNPRERFYRALQGQRVDRPPVTFWQHAPGRDLSGRDLAEFSIQFQQAYDLDIVKITPSGSYLIVDYGVQIEPAGNALGTSRVTWSPIVGPSDWWALPTLSADSGSIAEMVEAVRLVRRAFGPDIPIVQTLFAPITRVAQLAGADKLGQHVVPEHYEAIRHALRVIADATIAAGRAMVEAGADGFFFATQHATDGALPGGRNTYDLLAAPEDQRVLQALRPIARALILHLHGPAPFFDLADRYPVDAVSWHDREIAPSLADAGQHTTRALAGGLLRDGIVLNGPVEAIESDVRNIIATAPGNTVLMPGCTLLLTTPPAHLAALSRAVRAGR